MSEPAKALIARLESLTAATETLLLESVQSKDRQAAAKLIRELRENLVRLGQAQANLWTPGPVVQITEDRRAMAILSNLSDEQLQALIARGKQLETLDVREVLPAATDGEKTDG